MSGVEVFTGRDARAATVERLAAPTSALHRADLEGQFKVATAIANATDAVPRSYRKQPGAVLLALAWAQQHDLDVLTTLQGVTFIEGRAVVDATMQRALAMRAGYELRIGLREDAATVEVLRHGEGIGAATYSMADAERAGLAGKKNWQQNPEDMLVARATTRAVRRFAPDVLLGMLSTDDLDDGAPEPPQAPPEVNLVEAIPPPFAEQHGLDPATPVVVDVELPDNPAPTAEPAPRDTASTDAPPSSVGAGRIDKPPWPNGASMRHELRERGITVPEAVREAHAIAVRMGIEPPSGSMDSIVKMGNPEYVEAFAQWVRAHDLAG